jgi:hypothetical protein
MKPRKDNRGYAATWNASQSEPRIRRIVAYTAPENTLVKLAGELARKLEMMPGGTGTEDAPR